MKNLLLIILTLGLTITISSCKKSSSDPTPSNSGNGGNVSSSTYFTSLDQTFTCDELYEHVKFKGHSFSVYGYDELGCVQSDSCIKWGQYFAGKDKIPYSIGGIGPRNGAVPLSVVIVNDAIKSKGSFRVGSYQSYATTAYGVFDSKVIQYAFNIPVVGRNVDGFDPINNISSNVYIVGIDEPGDFYAEITKIQRVYPKELTDDNLYVIEGNKKILTRSYDGISPIAIDDTLITTYKKLTYLTE